MDGGPVNCRALAAVALTWALVGCSNDPSNPDTPRGKFGTTEVSVGDRQIPCITWKAGYAGGISCDWDG